MIVGIVKLGSGVVPLEEFRAGTDVTSVVTSFCNDHTPALNPIDFLGVDTGWTSGDPKFQKKWFYNFNTSTIETSLNGIKDEIILEIKVQRSRRFDTGTVLAEYPSASGKFFSCSVASQDNWAKLATLDSLTLISFPFRVTTYDEREYYDIPDSAGILSGVSAVSSAVLIERTLASGYILAVLAATDEASARQAAEDYLLL